METITTLNEMRSYFAYLETLPAPRGPQDAEVAIRPLLDALEDWDSDYLGALLLNLGAILALRRGEHGTACLRAALIELGKILQKKELQGHLN